MARIIKREEVLSTEAESQLAAFARGELTWAQVEGMTLEEARAIARTGCELAAAGRLEEARTIFEGLVVGNPKDTASRAALGTVYQRLGRIDDAVAEYSRTLDRDPGNAVALVHRGELRLRNGDREGFADVASAANADPKAQTPAGKRAKALVEAITLFAVKQVEASHA